MVFFQTFVHFFKGHWFKRAGMGSQSENTHPSETGHRGRRLLCEETARSQPGPLWKIAERPPSLRTDGHPVRRREKGHSRSFDAGLRPKENHPRQEVPRSCIPTISENTLPPTENLSPMTPATQSKSLLSHTHTGLSPMSGEPSNEGPWTIHAVHGCLGYGAEG